MREQLNIFVDFCGDFPKTHPYEAMRDTAPEAIPGKEVAALLATGLERRGLPVHNVEAVDFERIVYCSSGDLRFCVHVWVDWEEMDRWEVCCPSTVGFIGWLFGRSDHYEHKLLLKAIDEILRQASGVRDIRWFPEYEMVGYREKRTWYRGPVVSR